MTDGADASEHIFQKGDTIAVPRSLDREQCEFIANIAAMLVDTRGKTIAAGVAANIANQLDARIVAQVNDAFARLTSVLVGFASLIDEHSARLDNGQEAAAGTRAALSRVVADARLEARLAAHEVVNGDKPVTLSEMRALIGGAVNAPPKSIQFTTDSAGNLTGATEVS